MGLTMASLQRRAGDKPSNLLVSDRVSFSSFSTVTRFSRLWQGRGRRRKGYEQGVVRHSG